MKRINARAESIVTTASFREAIKKRRCLVPAGAFYEWQKIGAKTKQAFAIGMLDGTQYGFAGLWESWKEENGTLLETELRKSRPGATCVWADRLSPTWSKAKGAASPRDFRNENYGETP